MTKLEEAKNTCEFINEEIEEMIDQAAEEDFSGNDGKEFRKLGDALLVEVNENIEDTSLVEWLTGEGWFNSEYHEIYADEVRNRDLRIRNYAVWLLKNFFDSGMRANDDGEIYYLNQAEA